MQKTYEILKDIVKFNPAITHFSLRLYKNIERSVWTPDTEVQYEWISVKDISNIESYIQKHELENWTIGLTNLVMTGRGIQYLLMLDYSVPQSIENEKQLYSKLSVFNKSGDVDYKLAGYLIKTDKSYHYLGKYITTQENFINFLGSSLLFRHTDQSIFIVDDRWLGHSLKKKFATIRISRKNESHPIVIREI